MKDIVNILLFSRFTRDSLTAECDPSRVICRSFLSIGMCWPQYRVSHCVWGFCFSSGRNPTQNGGRENTQSPHRRAPGSGIEPRFFLLRGTSLAAAPQPHVAPAATSPPRELRVVPRTAVYGVRRFAPNKTRARPPATARGVTPRDDRERRAGSQIAASQGIHPARNICRIAHRRELVGS